LMRPLVHQKTVASTLTAKGQTTVPMDIRVLLGAKPGDRLYWNKTPDGKITVRVKTGSIKDLEGCIPKPKKYVSIEDMNRAIAQMGRMNNGRP
jgi:antitoxin PrlF